MNTQEWFKQLLEECMKCKDFWIESLILALEERIEDLKRSEL